MDVFFIVDAFRNQCVYAPNQLYNSVIFEGAALVYRPDCNAEGQLSRQ